MSRARGHAPEPASAGAPAGPPRAARIVAAPLAALDRLFDRVYGSRWNPLHQSGNLAILFFLVTIGSGLYLFLFYKIAEPHASVTRIQEEIFLGSWVRSLHRYSADLAIVAILVHLWRKLAQGHTWGPRALAWTSGVVLLGMVLFCGWTGLVLVWDVQGLLIADEGARLIDLLPLFSLPIRRSFSGEAAVPSSFFFMNLFLHVAAPLGLAALLWLHLSRIARPVLLPPRALRRTVLALLALFAVVWPVALPPEADLRALPGRIPLDLFYAFWLPLARRVPPLVHLAAWALGFTTLLLLARWWRPRRSIAVSHVDESLCVECHDCYQDCPYEAISMVPRTDFSVQRSPLVARVDPDRCVGCGICAGSCAPMGVGPAALSGREQLAEVRRWLASHPPDGREVLVLACSNGPGSSRRELAGDGISVLATGCAGSLHTSAVELLVRSGVGGVFVLACPPRNCSFREGAKWAEARLFAGHSAELKPRVDRRRIAFATASAAEIATARIGIRGLVETVRALDTEIEREVELEAECPTGPEEEVVGA